MSNRKVTNLIRGLIEQGYASTLMQNFGGEVDKKKEKAHMVSISFLSNPDASAGTRKYVELTEKQVEDIAQFAKKKGYLTFLDRGYRWVWESVRDDFPRADREEWNFIFFPSHIVGRLKQHASRLQKEVSCAPEFLLGEAPWHDFHASLKGFRKTLLQVTKHAVLDARGNTQNESFAPFLYCIMDMATDWSVFPKQAGLPMDDTTFAGFKEYSDTLLGMTALLKKAL